MSHPYFSFSNQLSTEEHVEQALYERFFRQQGWSLPTRSKFKYSNSRQCFKYFMDGENSGKKMSPEEVHILLRQDLTPDEYGRSLQIRSLYSNWSKKTEESPPEELTHRYESIPQNMC